MRRFSRLFAELDETTSTNDKRRALWRYFAQAPPRDAGWAVFFLTGQTVKRLVPRRDLRAWTLEASGTPEWLYEECLEAAGDFGETLALLLDGPGRPGFGEETLSDFVEKELLPLATQTAGERRRTLRRWAERLSGTELLMALKLALGEFRVGVSRTLVESALARWLDVPQAVVAHRLMGPWQPSDDFVLRLRDEGRAEESRARPYPFFLASPLEEEPAELGPVSDWLVERKWDGIRAQLVRRGRECFLWSRGEESLIEQFPEIVAAGMELAPGTVLDGELVAWDPAADRVGPFSFLQTRIMRKKATLDFAARVPVRYLAFDLLERKGRDLRAKPLRERRAALEALNRPPILGISPPLSVGSWAQAAQLRARSREERTEGLMLKRLSSPYRAGRRRGDWWKWKIGPLTVEAVLIYAQTGHGRRANLFTDYTFGLWSGSQLVSVAKAYSGLSDAEIAELDRWIRSHTVERFGPVRAVEPFHVFELGFEGVWASPRHKSGLAVRFPRMLRWRRDKKASEADKLETLRALVEPEPELPELSPPAPTRRRGAARPDGRSRRASRGPEPSQGQLL